MKPLSAALILSQHLDSQENSSPSDPGVQCAMLASAMTPFSRPACYQTPYSSVSFLPHFWQIAAMVPTKCQLEYFPLRKCLQISSESNSRIHLQAQHRD